MRSSPECENCTDAVQLIRSPDHQRDSRRSTPAGPWAAYTLIGENGEVLFLADGNGWRSRAVDRGKLVICPYVDTPLEEYV